MEPANQNTPAPNPTSKKSKMPTFIFFLLFVLAVLVGGVIYWSSSNDSSTSTTTVDPADSLVAEISGESEPPVVKVGEVVKVSIYVNSGEEPVNAVGATFTYPEEKLEFVQIDTEGSMFPTVAASKGGSGVVKFEAGIAPGGSGVTGKQLLAVVEFRAIGQASTSELTFTEETQVISAETNKDVLGNAQSVQITLEEN